MLCKPLHKVIFSMLVATAYPVNAQADSPEWETTTQIASPYNTQGETAHSFSNASSEALARVAQSLKTAAAITARDRLRAKYSVTVSAHSLHDVLSEFSSAMEVTPLVSEFVGDQRVDEVFENQTGQEILDSLGRRYGFDWWLEGETLRVTARSEAVSRLMSLEGVKIAEIQAAMTSLGVWEEKFPITNDGNRIAFVSGPPAYVALVELITADLAEKRTLEAAAFRAAEQVRAEERQRQIAAYQARREAEERELERRRAEYEARRQEMIQRVEEAARLRALWELRAPKVVRGGGVVQ